MKKVLVHEEYQEKDNALLITSADKFFWAFTQAVSYYSFAVVNYINFMTGGWCWRVLRGYERKTAD